MKSTVLYKKKVDQTKQKEGDETCSLFIYIELRSAIHTNNKLSKFAVLTNSLAKNPVAITTWSRQTMILQ